MQSTRREIIVGVLVFLFSTPLGYYFNYFMVRDKVSIQNIEIIPDYEGLKFNGRLYSEIKVLEQELFRFGGWTDYYIINGETNEYETSQLKSYLQNTLEKSKIINDKLKEHYSKGNSLNVSEVDFNYLPVNPFRTSAEPSISDIINTLKSTSKKFEDLINKINKLLVEISNHKKERNGECKIKVTFLNSGETDGLIRHKGTLFLNGIEEGIPIKIKKTREELHQIMLNYNYRYSSAVKKRSITEMLFIIDKGEAKLNLMNELKSRLRENQSFEYNIELRDFRNEVVSSNNSIMTSSDAI